MKKTWWKESVVYQIYPRSFCDSNGDGMGDLNGITEKLPYLRELGIDVIWLSPVYQSPGDDNGYDISDYKAILKEFGTMEDFDRMLARAHELGIRIMMDLVVNHTSDEHAWFIESRSSEQNARRDFYIWRKGRGGKAPNNWGACFGGSAWKYEAATDSYYLHLFSPKQPDLNWDNEEVRKEIFAMMTWWCEKGIDGFRMDVISMISKDPALPDGPEGANGYGDFAPYCVHGPHVHDYLKEMRREVLDKYDLITVGECSGVTTEEAKKYAAASGEELNMVFHFEHMALDEENGCKWSGKRIRLTELKRVMSRWQTELAGKAWNSLYWCNHDQPRMLSRIGADSPGYRERAAKMLATCLHMMQGTPYIFQGEEIGMTNYPFRSMEELRDIESLNAYKEYTEKGIFSPEEMFSYICRKSRDNARTPMQWDDGPQAGFTAGEPWIAVNPNYREINVKEQLSREDSVFYYYKKLIALRHTDDCIVYGDYELLLPDSEEIYAYVRSLEGERLLVACNFTDQEAAFLLPEQTTEEFSGGQVILSNCGRKDGEGLLGAKGRLAPYESVVLQVKA